MLDRKTIQDEEGAIQAESLLLEDRQRHDFHGQCSQRLKDPDTYAALAWSLPVGLHHFYLGKWEKALLDISLMLAGIIFLSLGKYTAILGIFLILGVVIAELYTLFRSQLIIQDHNNKIMRKTLQSFRN
jgi:hypothetical protein